MSVHALALAIMVLVSPGGVTLPHMANAPMGAAHRAESLATTFTIAADANGLDVALLVALAHWESGLDPSARTRSSSGILQLNRKFHRDVFRDCARRPERCSVANIDRGAAVLAAYKRRCGTDIVALRAYRLGHCGPPTERERKVLRTAAWIRRRIEGV